MNFVFVALILLSSVSLLIISPNLILTSMTNSAANATALTIKMLGIYAIWLGLMAICEKTGISRAIAKALRPTCKFLFGDLSEKGYEYITMNLSANLLGLGNAATPMGIKGTKEIGDNTFQLAMLMVINATSIQILPTTVLSLMMDYKSSNPSIIIFPSLIATAVSTVVGVLLTFVFFSKKTSGGKKATT